MVYRVFAVYAIGISALNTKCFIFIFLLRTIRLYNIDSVFSFENADNCGNIFDAVFTCIIIFIGLCFQPEYFLCCFVCKRKNFNYIHFIKHLHQPSWNQRILILMVWIPIWWLYAIRNQFCEMIRKIAKSTKV